MNICGHRVQLARREEKKRGTQSIEIIFHCGLFDRAQRNLLPVVNLHASTVCLRSPARHMLGAVTDNKAPSCLHRRERLMKSSTEIAKENKSIERARAPDAAAAEGNWQLLHPAAETIGEIKAKYKIESCHLEHYKVNKRRRGVNFSYCGTDHMRCSFRSPRPESCLVFIWPERALLIK